MKTNYKKIFGIVSLAAITTLGIVSCKDEVLVPVKDEKSTDSLASLINVLDKQKITLDKKINAITITNATLKDSTKSIGDIIDNDITNVEYTVNLINAGTAITTDGGNGQFDGGGDRKKGVDGISVTVVQGGVATTVTSASGRAIFTGLSQGTASVSITGTNFLPVKATVYLGWNSTGIDGDGAVREVSSNVLLLPSNGGTDGLTITGKLYINKNVINDTLGRQFAKASDAANYTKYISKPSIWDYYSLNGYYQGVNLFNLYGNNTYNSYTEQLSFDALTSGATVYAYPEVANYYNPANWAENGYFTSITYTGLISYATVDANGAYSIKVPYVYSGAASSDIGYYIYADQLIDNLTKFDGNDGTSQNTVGSVKTAYTLYDNATYTKTPTDRYVLTQPWIFLSAVTVPGDYDYFGSGYVDGSYTHPGSTIASNIFYFPYRKN